MSQSSEIRVVDTSFVIGLMVYKTVECFVEKHIHLNLNYILKSKKLMQDSFLM